MIKEIQNTISKGFKSKADVNYFFTLIRVLLEAKKRGTDFKVIKFYSDWMLHCQKDNLKEMYDYFEALNKSFNEGEVWDRRSVNEYVERLTSFVYLRDQLKGLLLEFDLKPKFLYEDELWHVFTGYLRELIINKPINFNKLKVESKYRKISVFVITRTAPFMIDVDDALYWIIFINTSSFPLHGVIPESIGLYS